jgi:hypothetical protein
MASKFLAVAYFAGGTEMELGVWGTTREAADALQREADRRGHTVGEGEEAVGGNLYTIKLVPARKYPHKDKHLTLEQRAVKYVAAAPCGVDTATVRAMYPRADLRRLDRTLLLVYRADKWWTPATWEAQQRKGLLICDDPVPVAAP